MKHGGKTYSQIHTQENIYLMNKSLIINPWKFNYKEREKMKLEIEGKVSFLYEGRRILNVKLPPNCPTDKRNYDKNKVEMSFK